MKLLHKLSQTQTLVSLPPNASVKTAADLMRQKSVGSVLVMDDDRLAGIFTERDLLNRVAAEKRDPATTAITEVMTPDPDTLRATDRVVYAINRMAHRGFRNIPIVDDSGAALAVLGVRDVMTHLADVFSEVAEHERESEWNEWTDTGGG